MSKILAYLFLPIGVVYYLLKSIVLLFVPLSLLPRKKILESDVILITGGGMGLGKAVAEHFIQFGAKKIVLWDINSQALSQTKRELETLGARVWTYEVDVTDRKKVYAVADKVKVEAGQVTYLVNNAGIVSGSFLIDLRDESIEKTFAVNSISHFWTLKAFLPQMIKSNRGHVVTIASMAGHTGMAYLTDYCSSKFAAVGTHEALKYELSYQKVTGVNTTCICPYFINTGMFSGVSTFYLETNDVALGVVLATLTNQDTLLIPSFLKLLIILSKVFSNDINMLVANTIGDMHAMSTFIGRNKAK